MAKSQKRSNREVRKPKAVKPAATLEPSALQAKGSFGTVNLNNKKKG
jgi:hypothetical protein